MSKRGRQEEASPVRNAKMAKSNLLGEDRIAPSAAGINVVQGSQGKACTHEVSWPEGLEGSPLPPQPKAGPPAKEYAFSLDPFQQTAINCLEAGQQQASILRSMTPVCVAQAVQLMDALHQ